MRYILTVLKSLSKIIGLVAMVSALQLDAKVTTIQTKSRRPGHFVTDNPTMKAWLSKMPEAFNSINALSSSVKITNIDVKWKQTNTTRRVAKAKRKKQKHTSYVCELQLTIQYQDTLSSEEAPSLTAMPKPLKVNSRCDTYLAKNEHLLPVQENTST